MPIGLRLTNSDAAPKASIEVGISKRLKNDLPIKTAELPAFPPPHFFQTLGCVSQPLRVIPAMAIHGHPWPWPMGSISSSRPNCFSNWEALSFTTDSMLSWRGSRRWMVGELGGFAPPCVCTMFVGKNKRSCFFYILIILGLPRDHGLHHQLVQRLVQVGRDKDHQQNDEGGQPLPFLASLDVFNRIAMWRGNSSDPMFRAWSKA